MDEKNQLLIEITNHTNHVIKILASSEIAIENGDLQTSLSSTKEARQLLKTIFKDTFLEFESLFNIKSVETNNYDTPTPLELIKNLANLGFNATSLSLLLSENPSGTVVENIKKQIARDMNTIKEIFASIYDN